MRLRLQNSHVQIGQRDHLSHTDIEKLLITYNCTDIKKGKDTMKNKKKFNSSKTQKINKSRRSVKKPMSNEQKVSGQKSHKSPKKSDVRGSGKLSDAQSETPNTEKITKFRKSAKDIASPKKRKKTKIRVSTENPISKRNARRHLERMLNGNEHMIFHRKHYDIHDHSSSSSSKHYPPPHSMIYLLIYPDFYFQDQDN